MKSLYEDTDKCVIIEACTLSYYRNFPDEELDPVLIKFSAAYSFAFKQIENEYIFCINNKPAY